MTTKNMTMNILKKLAGTFALAAAAFAAPFSASAEEGDISRIYPCNAGGVQVANGSVDDPIHSGGTFYFAVRVLKRDTGDSPWRLHHVATSSKLVDDLYNPLEIGIYVSGKLTYAKYVGDTSSDTARNYTDFIFSYDVKPGDFAMPVVLAVDQDNPTPANSIQYKGKAYHFSPTSLSKWAIDDSTEASVATQTANFYFKSDAEGADYDLRGAGFYVQTLDFSPTAYEVPSSGEEVQATIKLENTPTNTVRLYVWSLDETQVKVKGTNKSIQFGPTIATDMQTRSVGTIDVVAGKTEYTVRMTAGTAPVVGRTTQIVLNGFDDFSYSALTNDRYTDDYLTADVTVGEPLEPSISFADAEGNSNPTIELEATTNTTVYKEVKLVFSKAYDDKDVNVKIKQQIGGKDVSADDDYQANRYFAILTKSDANPISTTYTDTITMPKGKKEVSFYVFALGSTDALASGISLVPDVSAEDSTVQTFFAKGTHGSALLQVTDQKPTLAVTAPSAGYCGDTASVKVTVADNWRDLQSAWNTKGYRVVIELGGETVYDQDGVQFESRKAKSFDVKIPVEGSVTGRVYVYDPTHEDDAAEATFTMNVAAARKITPVFYPNTETLANRTLFAEGEKAYFGVTMTSPAMTDMYAFLVPQNEAASNLVTSAAFSNGLFIASGVTNSATRLPVSFLDGYADMVAKFTVELRDREKIDDPASRSLDASYVLSSAQIACTNVSPWVVANSVEYNKTTVANGATLMARIPVNTEVTFRARVRDPSSIDLTSAASPIQVRWQITEGSAASKTMRSEEGTCDADGYVTCKTSFGYEGTTQTVNLYVRDKDDVEENGEYEWGALAYTFNVTVADTPKVIISQDVYGSNTTFSVAENASLTEASFYLQLSSLPNGYVSGDEIKVKFNVESWGGVGNLELLKDEITLGGKSADALNPSSPQKVYFKVATLNGVGPAGDEDALFHVTADVTSTTGYATGAMDVKVYNVDPEIRQVKRLDGSWVEGKDGMVATNSCVVGETVTLSWKVSDVEPDVSNGDFEVLWSLDPVAGYTNPQTDMTGYSVKGRSAIVDGTYAFKIPDVSGSFHVTMTVTDGDEGMATKEWLVDVAPTKALKVNVFGPASSAQSKYGAAAGIGQGVVAAKGANKWSVETFYQNWTYSETSQSAELFAWGYPSKETWDDYVAGSAYEGNYVDSGIFPTVLDVASATGLALSRNGNTWTVGPYYDWSTMGGSDSTAGDYDSYFYRWMVTADGTSSSSGSSSSSSSSSSDSSENDAAPTLESLATTRKSFALGEGSDDGFYGTVEIEAIFSRELRPLDNLGDINADGIPDKIVQLYGINAGESGKIPVDDLTSLNDFNDDEDYLPDSSTAASYSTLIPGLPSSWSKTPFTAKLEVRGYHEGLNDGAQLAGLKNHKLHPDYNSDDLDKRKAARDYSELEILAWSLVDYDKGWSPERPSDPTMADTDGDGFPDGYEYYFWYRAHVGDPDYFKQTGICRKMTGRRYDPRNPGFGTVITTEEIAAVLDPIVAYTGDAKTIDTDNDGLPDLLEYELGTNPFDFDTDGDGLPDGWEVMIANLDPLVTYSYIDDTGDRLRNTDGDAMAISSYKLEKTQSPVPVNYEHAKRLTFAVVDANGDTAGIQWYALPISTNSVELVENADFNGNGFKLVATVDGLSTTFFSNVEPELTAAGLLKRDVSVWTLTTYKPAGAEAAEDVVAYPYVLRAGAAVRNEGAVTAKQYQVKTAIGAKGANACWIYGKGSARAELGEVAETAADYGCLALARQKAVPAGAVIAAFPSEDRDVAFLHYLCYQEFGFDPRTAWSTKSPLASRWGKITNGEAEEDVIEKGRGAYTGTPSRTRDYANYDEVLVRSFFQNNTPDDMGYNAIDVDSNASAAAKIWYAFTTNPNGPTDDLTATSTNFYGRTSTNGADTDGDGVPDGWELYTMAGPKTRGGAYVFAPPYAGFSTSALVGDDTGIGLDLGDDSAATEKLKMPQSYFSPFVASAKSSETSNQIYLGGQGMSDGLNQFQEFEGTDSIAAYTNVSTTIAHEGSWKWLNKFFPTDPWNPDTDGDGVTDASEKSAFSYGELGGDGLVDNGTSRCIAGGGLNPCSVDTDFDGLPDGWELQFTGTAASVVKQSEGMLDGMDGTVSDACTTLGGPNRDYDHDGLENWQEYLTGTMRCWRYDDPISPLTYWPSSMYCKLDEKTQTYEFDFDTAVENFKAAGYLVKDGDEANGEFLYKTFVDATSPMYNPHLVMDRAAGSQYFSHLTNVWDAAYLDASQGGKTGAYYWFYDRINDTKLSDSWFAAWEDLLKEAGLGEDITLTVAPSRYASCSPIDPDSDHDGMDDYYEVFHGMNPLLGESGVAGSWWFVNKLGAVTDSDPCDLVFDSLGGAKASGGTCVPQAWGEGDEATSFKNFWQRKVELASYDGLKPRGTGYDFVVFPWLNGLATADADGDGIRNQEESIMSLVSPESVWHHTDPTALWMTDSSYTNSLVSMNYRLANRSSEIKFPSDKFTQKNGKYCFVYEGKEYVFNDLDGYAEIADGLASTPGLGAFSTDTWSVLGTDADANGWIASFEENEGFDSDHDGLGDRDEISGKYHGKTDPIDVDSPRRRQAMYFQGPDKPSILQTMPFVPERHPSAMTNGRYPDDMSFLQYTVECWVKAESLDDSTIIERVVYVGRSNPDDQEFVRCNFRLAISGGKWLTSFDPNDTTKESVDVYSKAAATTEWTHLAATYDATALRLYVNGSLSAYCTATLQPTYGSSSVTVDGVANVHARPSMAYWRDSEYDLHAIIVGASAKTLAQGAKDGTALDVTRGGGFDLYTSFFKGYVDEIRVWDGARSATQIQKNYASRFTAADAKANREDFYAEWCKLDENGHYRGRYSKDGDGNAYDLPAELRFHWAFDSLFGASDEGIVAKVPAGFNYLGDDSDGNGARARRTRPDDYGITWWQTILAGYADTVYDDPAWICWVPNTVAHLPRYDSTTLDSVYWSEDFAGAKNGTYKFVRTAEPVSLWTQYRREGVSSGSPNYDSMSSRHHFANWQDSTNGTSLATLYEFTGRHLNLCGDDMLALGGAYAKHVDAMWDDQGPSANWEISGNDDDGDGLPDWWEAWADEQYRDDPVTGDGDIGWNTIVKWPDKENGTHMTAGEAYLRDLARGYHADKYGEIVIDGSGTGENYRQRADLNGNGLPDWWEELYGISGEDALADHDNDGLPNYVEYMLSEVFRSKGAVFDPTRADSVQEGIPDYFYKVGELYVGEIFTDHDLVDDSWEDNYGTDYASRRVYDPYEDADGDGWSNRSENRYSKQSMPIVANEQAHYAATDGLVADYPIPTLSLTIHYAGSQASAVEKANLIVQTTTSTNLTRSVDASYYIKGRRSKTTAGTGTSSSTSSSNSQDAQSNVSYTRTLGKWSNRHAIGTLTPGYISQNSLVLEYCYNPSAEIYRWDVIYGETFYVTKRGTRAEFDADRRKYGDGNVSVLSRGTSYSTYSDIELRTDDSGRMATWILTSSGKTLGTIDLTSGAFDLDLGVFAGVYVVNATNDSDRASLEDQYFRIAYSANTAVGLPRKLYLGQADEGHVREGKNTVIAFADLDDNGAYTAGEPYGCVAGVDVSWNGTSVDLTLTETTPLMNRVDPIGGSDDRTAAWGTESGNYTNFTPKAQASGGTYNRVRLVRYKVIGTKGQAFADNVGPSRVILDTVLDTSDEITKTDTSSKSYASMTSWITEANILATGALDLDWDYLYSDIISKIDSEGKIASTKKSGSYYVIGDVKAVVYGLVIGSGDIDASSTNVVNYAKVLPQRNFDVPRQLPVPVSVGSGGIVTVGRPTFKWTMANDVNGYTAFKLKIASKSGSSFSWTSDFQRMPAADENGVYTWAAPVFVGDTPAGATGVFANNQTYTWSISAYNAKFKSDSFVTGGDFYLGVQTNGYDTGTALVKVHYYGPSAVTNGYVTRVYAYESPDFTGTPVAGSVASAFDGTNVNCRIIGLPKGSYYLQAFVDSNNNGVWDKWESMGYLCTRDGSIADYLNPVSIKFDSKVGANDVAVIYMEDADTDRDNLPDAWEYATATAAQRANGTFLNAKGVSTLTTLDGAEIPVNKTLTGTLIDEFKKLETTTTAGLAGEIQNSFVSSASFAALAMGVSDTSAVTYDAVTGTLSVNPTVEDGTFAITGVSFDAENGQVSLTLDGDVVAAENVTSTIYTVKKGSTITVKVYRSETLAEEPTLVATKQILVSGETINGSVITVDTDLSASSGFFKVVVE